MVMDPNSTATLFEIGMTASPAKMYLYIRDKDGTQPVKSEPGGVVTEVASATPIISNNTSTTWTSTSYYSKYSWNVKSDTGIVTTLILGDQTSVPRVCWAGEPGDDMLSQQSTPVIVHDP